MKIYQGTFLFVSELIQCESFSYDAHLAPARIITHKQFKNWGFISFCHGMYAGQSDRSICCQGSALSSEDLMWPELHVRGVFKSKVNCFMFAQQRQDRFSLGYFFMLSGIFQSLLLDKSRTGYVNLCQKLFFLQNMGRTWCVQKLF